MKIRLQTNAWWQVLHHVIFMASKVLGGMALFFYVYLPTKTNHGESLTVPDLKGMTLSEAQAYLEERGLQLIVKDSVFKPNTPAQVVLDQNPPPSVQVKEERKIYLTITPQEAPTIPLPRLVGLGFETAKNKLQKEGFLFGNITYEPHLEENNVLKVTYNGETLTQGTLLPQGIRLDLVIGGSIEESFDVPKLVGLTQEEAEAVIHASELEVGVIKYIFDQEEPLGTVIRQYPVARKEIVAGKLQNAQIKVGELVDLWVVGNPEAAPILEEELPNDTLPD